MDIYTYIMIYVLVGVVLSAIFDTMHYLTKDVVDAETYEANGFSNLERISVILTWPRIVLGLLLVATGATKVSTQEETKDEEETKE